MPTPVSDPDILAQLNAPARSEVAPSNRVWGDQEAEAAGLYDTPKQINGNPVTDPAILAQLNGSQVGPSVSVRPFRERFQEPSPPENAPALESGLRSQGIAQMRGPEMPTGSQLLADFQNQGAAAAQGTTPNIRAQMANLISDQVYEGDSGFAAFKDPATGQIVEAQDNKHVILRDPHDGRLKVFGRTDNTDEGRLSAGGRLLGMGMGTGAVTRRPAIPSPSNVQVRASDVFSTAKPYYRAFEQEASRIGVPAETGTGIADRLRSALDKRDLIPDMAPTVYKAIDLLDEAQSKLNAGGKLTLDNLQRVKRVVGRGFNSPDKNVRDAAGIVSAELSKVMAEVSPSAAANLKQADAIHSTANALQDLQRKEQIAGLRTGRAGYGGNSVNAMRQVLSPIIQKSIEGRKTPFKPDEIAAMREIVEGNTATNTLRGIGQFSPTKGAIANMASGGAMYAAGPVAAVIPVLGAASNKLAAVLTGGQIEQLKELVAKRSPAYAEAVRKATERYEKAQLDLVSQPSVSRFGAYLAASRQLSNGLTRDGVQVSSGDLMRAIQGPMQGRAGNEQPKPEGVVNQ